MAPISLQPGTKSSGQVIRQRSTAQRLDDMTARRVDMSGGLAVDAPSPAPSASAPRSSIRCPPPHRSSLLGCGRAAATCGAGRHARCRRRDTRRTGLARPYAVWIGPTRARSSRSCAPMPSKQRSCPAASPSAPGTGHRKARRPRDGAGRCARPEPVRRRAWRRSCSFPSRRERRVRSASARRSRGRAGCGFDLLSKALKKMKSRPRLEGFDSI